MPHYEISRYLLRYCQVMKRFLLVFALLGWLGGSGSSLAATAEFCVSGSADGVWSFRASPSLTGRLLANIANDTCGIVVSSSAKRMNGYVQVKIENQTGWIIEKKLVRATSTPTQETLSLIFGFTPGENASVGGSVTNNSEQKACGVSITFTFVNSSGRAIKTRTERIATLASRQSAFVAQQYVGTIPLDARLKASWVVDSFGSTCTSFSMTKGIKIKVIIDSFSGTEIQGRLRNLSSLLAETTYITCVLLDSADKPIGGLSTASLDPIQSGEEIAWNTSAYTPATSVVCEALA
jgi:hypothetical protein